MSIRVMRFLFAIYLLSFFNIFHLTNFVVYSQLFVMLCTVAGAYNIIRYKLLVKYRDLKVIIAITILMILASLMASQASYGQSLFSGLIGSIKYFLMVSPFAFYKLFEKQKFRMDAFLDYFLVPAWIFAGLVFYMSVFNVFWIFNSPLSGESLFVDAGKLNKEIIFFAVIYYFLAFLKSMKVKYLIFMIFLFGTTQIVDIQRGDVIFLAFTIGWILYKYRRTRSVKYFIPVVLLIALLGAFYIIDTALDVSGFSERFEAIFQLVGGDLDSIVDASVWIRIQEAKFALDKFVQQPLFGNGMLRPSVASTVIKIYFYPGDIGIIGVLYVFGIFGIGTYSFMWYAFAKKLSFQRLKLDVLHASFYAFLFYRLLYTIKDGSIMYEPVQFVFVYLILSLGFKKDDEPKLIKETALLEK